MKNNSNRKKRSTRKTRQCKRNKNRRTRRQRGGLTKEDVFDNVITEYAGVGCEDKLIKTYFVNCNNFLKLLKHKRLPVLKNIVCNKSLTDDDIRTNELTFAMSQDVKNLKIQNIETNWPAFVVHLKNVVENKFKTHEEASAAASAAAIEQGLWNLKFPTSEAAKAANAAKAAKAAKPASTAVAAAAVPASTAAAAAAEASRPVAPVGWKQVGNVWQGPDGAFVSQDTYRHPTGDELAARLAALADD